VSKKGRRDDAPKPAQTVPPEPGLVEPDPELVQVLRKDESGGQKKLKTQQKQMVE